MTTTSVRSDLIEFLRRDLVGPAHGEEEELEDSPKIRYVAGVLFPQESQRDESASVGGVDGDEDVTPDRDADKTDVTVEPAAAEDDTPDESGARTDDGEQDDAVTLANSYRPAAMGMSFLVEGAVRELVVQARVAVYETRRGTPADSKFERTTWKRVPLRLEPARVPLGSGPSEPHDRRLTEGLRLRVVVRPFRDARRLVTVSLYNETKALSRSAKVFFQTGFEVTAADGGPAFPEYATLDGMPDDPEETALAMLYRKRRAFAVGHGCAADWDGVDDTHASRLATASMPSVVVPPVVPHGFDAPGLSMQYLSGDGPTDPGREVPAALEQVCAAYEEWVRKRTDEAASIETGFRNAAAEHLALCRCALDRMRRGVRLLATDRPALEAFMLANRVMLMQQHHSRLRRKWSEPWTALPKKDEYRSDWAAGDGYWRVFQIAFVLMTLPGLVNAADVVELGGQQVASRDLVDLIWFPTGGGKTEAYLAVAAFSIFTARQQNKTRRGCLVLMRYTLRLLTSQQFQRAASLVCACEVVRRGDPARFGELPISIGLWVGVSLTPNSEADAIKRLTKLRKNSVDAKNPFQLLSCPWCGTELNHHEHLGYIDRNGRQMFVCPATECPFSKRDRPLPVCVVDESIYLDPPTLLIGTVDKFALLAWKAKAGRLFEIGGGPEVIIQDELHLIAGPLGSMVGLYESAIDYLCSRRGRRPKIIASTATIRRAKEQCAALYDRPMFQFPPPGLDASDSYFAVEDRLSPGRVYVGILPTASSSPLTAQIRTVVALQQGAFTVAQGDEAAIDPYWTLIQYFGSLKELGRAATFVTADIPEFLPTMHRRWGLTGAARRFMHNAEELTSRKDEDEIPKILKMLETKYHAAARPYEQALDTVLATNMISVGMDVQRLGLMLVVTQPKGTSEYIQASSRVGRRHPGGVVTLYNSGRPRDRSHYEHFRSYHSAFYRHVEPTSVTPFSPPAMVRALHALLVIAGRHVAGWNKPTDLDRTDPAFAEFLAYLGRRIQHIDPDHGPEFEAWIETRLREWRDNAPRNWGELVGQRDERVLMRVTGSSATLDDPNSWETPTSMRNVDVECGAAVIPGYPRVIAGGGR